MIVYGFIVFVVIASIILLSVLIGPKNPTPTKDKPFECGNISLGNIENTKVPISFYKTALAFLVFDIEILFLLPLIFAGQYGLKVAVIFICIISLGLIFELKNNKFFV